uniref:Phospholipid scramblase n=1 Tax=Trichobilharzia regenti TaxID=157069 RepID=A0AA85KLI8_TRIRE|nr:unnamed protein product [Trichobilharzia regenti]
MWMQKPATINCPPGLEYLTQIDQLLVKQSKELCEIILSFETKNRYTCYNVLGQPVYKCFEESGFCVREFCGSSRPFLLHIVDGNNSEVILARRPFRCDCFPCCSCCDCCLSEIEVESPPGNIIGYVKQVYNGCYRNYHILDHNQTTVLQIHGPPYCLCECIGQNIDFKITSAHGAVEIGKITKKWTNVLQELFTDADNFGVTFPMDLEVRMKAVVLAAVFLIDFMYFEESE